MNPASLLTLLALSQPAHVDDRPTEICAPSVVESFASVDNAMRQLERNVDDLRGSRHDRERAQRALSKLQEELLQARTAACRAARVVVMPRPAVMILDDNGERSVVREMRREMFDEQRITALSSMTSGVCLTATQARDFTRELTYSRGRVDAVRVLAPRIVDRNARFDVLDSFDFSSDKRAAREILSTTPPAPECIVQVASLSDRPQYR